MRSKILKRMREGRYYRLVCKFDSPLSSKEIPIVIQYFMMKHNDYEVRLIYYECEKPNDWVNEEQRVNEEQIKRFGGKILAPKDIVIRIERIDQEEVKREVMLRAL